MSVYPKEVFEMIRSLRYAGYCEMPNAVGSEALFDCGCFVTFELRVASESQNVEEVRYRTNGCGFLAASAESIADRLFRRSLTELMGSVVPDSGVAVCRATCAEAAVRAVEAAFADHRSRLIGDFQGEKALICTCFGVGEEEIEDYVRKKSPENLEEVVKALRAGSGCGACRMMIQEIMGGI